MRAFIAINLPSDIKNYLSKLQDQLKTTLPKIGWVKPANLHLSLKFLGEISSKQAENIQQIIAAIIKTTLPFEIKLETLGVFPDYQTARIIWIGTHQPPPGLKQLAEQLEKKLPKTGIPEEGRFFQAHITLGRIKQPLIAVDLEKTLNTLKSELTAGNLKFNAGGVTLFQSLLGPGGPTYNILKEEVF
jgi:2'-5' RNA ligase